MAGSQVIQSGFEFGYVKTDYDWGGESVWLANTKMTDRVSNKSIASLHGDGSGKVNINGNDVDLKLVKYYSADNNEKIGRGGYQIWKGDGVRLRNDYIITRLCSAGDEDCIVYYYKGTMNITYHGKRRKVKITGFGGS